MKEVPTLFQVVTFGDFSGVQANGETVRFFMDIFSSLDLDLIPSIPEPNQAGAFVFSFGPVPKISFVSSDTPWLITFSNDRLDIYCRKQATDGPEFEPLDEFVRRAIKVVEATTERYGTKFGRLSLVTRTSWVDLSDPELSEMFLKRINGPEYFTTNVPHEWSFRLVSRHQLETMDEKLNVIASLLRAKLRTSGDPETTVEGVECTLDINTSPENVEARFDASDVKQYLDEVIALENKVRKELAAI